MCLRAVRSQTSTEVSAEGELLRSIWNQYRGAETPIAIGDRLRRALLNPPSEPKEHSPPSFDGNFRSTQSAMLPESYNPLGHLRMSNFFVSTYSPACSR